MKRPSVQNTCARKKHECSTIQFIVSKKEEYDNNIFKVRNVADVSNKCHKKYSNHENRSVTITFDYCHN